MHFIKEKVIKRMENKRKERKAALFDDAPPWNILTACHASYSKN
jgi:hypothetical protein